MINNIQNRGTTFPVSIQNTQARIDSNALMDTGATRSCMNYSTACKLGRNNIKQFRTMQVVRADGSDLGAVGTLQCKITIGDIEVQQTFIVCRHLRRNVILGNDFAKENQAGVSWTKQGTWILSIKGVDRLEMEEDELGVPMTTKYHVKIPPRYSAVFEVNLHGTCEGTKIISANKQFIEMNPNLFQHEISIRPEGNKYFPGVAITNLDHTKMTHLAKGETVGFTHEEEVEMNYIETTNILEMGEIEEKAPRNWIPERSWKTYNKYSRISQLHTEITKVTLSKTKSGEISPDRVEVPEETKTQTAMSKISQQKSHKRDHKDISDSEEDFETDFLISPGDVYPNRKVKLEDADITEETKKAFEGLH